MQQESTSGFERLAVEYKRLLLMVTEIEQLLAKFEVESGSKLSSEAQTMQQMFRVRSMLALLSSRVIEIRECFHATTLQNLLKIQELMNQPLMAKSRTRCMEVLLFSESSREAECVTPLECLSAFNNSIAHLDSRLYHQFLEALQPYFPQLPSPAELQRAQRPSASLLEFSRPALPQVPEAKIGIR